MPRDVGLSMPQPILSEPIFSEAGNIAPDPGDFDQDHTNDKYTYSSIADLQKTDVVTIPPMRGAIDDITPLAQAYGSAGSSVAQTISMAGKIAFHVAGDTGATSASGFNDEITVTEALTNDVRSTPAPADSPAFLYHLGDLVYNFGASADYYEQFYDAFRDYPRPIYAIPGNHDSFIVPGTVPSAFPLTTFQRNFCATDHVVTPEAGSLHRTAQTQPGVYFTLDAPFVRIIGLFSNALEDPGVISSESGKWPVSDIQLAYLQAELARVKKETYSGALLIAVHHPPYSYATKVDVAAAASRNAQVGGSPAMLRQIDSICDAVGVYPHAFLSGHAHNYQRYLRKITLAGALTTVPYIVCGNGGHHVNKVTGFTSAVINFGDDVTFLEQNAYQSPTFATSGVELDEFDDTAYGYLRLIVDKNAKTLTISYQRVSEHEATKGIIKAAVVDISRSAIYKP